MAQRRVIPEAEALGVSKADNVDFFGSEIVRTGKLGNAWTPVYHIIDVSLPAGGVLNLMRSGSQVVTEALNEGIPLLAGVGYRFAILLSKDGDTYNLQHSTGGTQNVTTRVVESLETE